MIIRIHDLSQSDLDPWSIEDQGRFNRVERPGSAERMELAYFIRTGELPPKPKSHNWDAIGWRAAEMQARFAKRPYSPLIEGLDI